LGGGRTVARASQNQPKAVEASGADRFSVVREEGEDSGELLVEERQLVVVVVRRLRGDDSQPSQWLVGLRAVERGVCCCHLTGE
jgi:hypothetical protein